MSYAVLHIMKASGSCNAIARHIERSTQPDNAHPELRHLNREDFIRYPEGVGGLCEAIRYRLDHAGLTRKIGKNQVLALNVLLTSDGEALRRLADERRLNEWAEASIGWAKQTFGEENVVGAHLHMDEQTPHLHVTVVPIVTTERKRKASEARATKRYRTKPKNGPRLSADDIMTRENLTRFQDTYAEAMARFGLERGIRGSEARHVDQHEYYRQCQMKKKGLEQDVATLSTEKEQLGTETQSLEKRKKELERGNRYMDKAFADTKAANAEMIRQNGELEKRKSELEKSNSSLTAANTSLITEKEALEADRKKKADEIAAIETDKSKLIDERSAYAKETEAARKEKETALQEAADAKAQRDANRKDAFSNLANRFTGSKTKRLESELAQSQEEVKALKERAEQTSKTHSNEMWNLRQQLDRQIEREKSIVRGHNDVIAKIERFFPDTIAMIPALEECEQVGIPDSFVRKLMGGSGRYLTKNVSLDYTDKNEKIEVVAGTTFKFIRDPSDNKFHLHINGTRIFQWLKEQWQSLKQSVKRGFGIR
jgi:hypothetical protein